MSHYENTGLQGKIPIKLRKHFSLVQRIHICLKYALKMNTHTKNGA